MLHATDCIIIGGGLAGLFSALELQRRGLRVTLLERARVGAGASGAAGGILCPLAPWREPPPVLSLADRALDLYEGQLARYPALAATLEHDTQAGQSLLRRPGLLHLGQSRGAATDRWLRAQHRSVEKLDRAGLRELAPGLEASWQNTYGQNTYGQSAFWLPWVRQVDSLRLAQAVRTTLVRGGAKVVEGEKVCRLHLRKGRLDRLESPRRSYSCGYAVIAAGAWSGDLLDSKHMGAELQPVRGQMLAYQAGNVAPEQILVYRGRYLIPGPNGRILVGSTLERSGFNSAVTTRARHALHGFAGRLVPTLRTMRPVAHWAGLRPATTDGLPRIGRVRSCANLYLNTGHFRNGVLLAPAAAEALARHMLDGKPQAALTPKQHTALRQTSPKPKK